MNDPENNPVLAVIENAVRRGDAALLIQYAQTAEAGGNLGVAIALWQKALSLKPTTDIALKLGQALENAQRDSEALAAFALVFTAQPDSDGAAQIYAEAVVRITDRMWKSDLPRAVQIQEEALALVGHHARARMMVLAQLMLHKEWTERINSGQAPFHAASMDDQFFRHARPLVEGLKTSSETVLAANPADNGARIMLAAARFCLGDRQGSEAMINSVPKVVHGSIWETFKTAPAFFDQLRCFSDEDIQRGLPPVIDLVPMPGQPQSIVYLSCNYAYFKAFALPMLMSLRRRAPSAAVHLHVMDADETEIAFISNFVQKLRPLQIAVSIETPGLQRAHIQEARSYYHAVRFIRLYYHLQQYRVPLWLMDVDALINRDLAGLFERLTGFDVAMRVRPARIEPWNQFNACMVAVNTTQASMDYFRQIAAYVAYFYQRGQLRWGIDQLAMYCVYADMEDRHAAPSVSLLGERDVDYDHTKEGYLWPNSGPGKMSHMQRIKTPGAPRPAAPTSPFDALFEEYWQEAVLLGAEVGAKL